MSNEQEIEAEIQAKGLTAPRLTPTYIDSLIIAETYFHADGTTRLATKSAELNTIAIQALHCLTVCVLVTANGFTFVGESACASPENFDAELGKKIARERARDKIWSHEGYALRNRLTHAEKLRST